MKTKSPQSTDEDSAPLVLSWHQAMLDDRLVSRPVLDAAQPRLRRIHDCLRMLDQLRRAQEQIPSKPRGQSQMFGKFEILEVLGKGGQGIVYKARDTALGRIVVLKAPQPETLDSPQLRQRLLRESQAASRLNHPNLVPVYEVGEVGPAIFIASQYCPGPTLAQWLSQQDQPVAPRLAAEIVEQLAEAVQYVHGFGILHRDIKPGNILLDRPENNVEGAAGRRGVEFIPRLTDFGLARLQDGSQLKTHTGAVLGTPAYMAPEQAQGHTSEFGPSMDVYALGAVLYELLAGRLAYTGQNDVEVLQKVCRGNPPSLRSLRRDTPRDLEAVCLKCLEYEPRRRYGSADELATDLDRFLAGEPVRARRSGWLDRLAKWSRRQPVVAALSALLLLSLVGGLAAAGWQWRLAEQARAQAEENFTQAHGAVGRLHNLLLESDEYDHPRYHAIKRQMLQLAIGYYQRMLEQRQDDLTLMANLADALTHLAEIQQSTGSHDEARRLYRKAQPLWELLMRDEPENLDHTYFLAKVHDRLGMLEQIAGRSAALEHYELALMLRESLVRKEPRRIGRMIPLAQSCENLAKFYAERGRRSEAYAQFIEQSLALNQKEEARAAYEKMIALDRRLANTNGAARIRMVNLQLALGLSYFSEQLPKAREHFDKAWRALEQLGGHMPEVRRQQLAGIIAGWLGAALEPMDKLEQAALWRRRAIAIEEDLLRKRGDDLNLQQRLANNYFALGYIEERRHRFSQAHQNYHAAHRFWKSLAAGADNPNQYEQLCETTIQLMNGVRDKQNKKLAENQGNQGN